MEQQPTICYLHRLKGTRDQFGYRYNVGIDYGPSVGRQFSPIEISDEDLMSEYDFLRIDCSDEQYDALLKTLKGKPAPTWMMVSKEADKVIF